MNELEFARRVRQALNEGAEHVDYRTALRLEQARKAALAVQKSTVAPRWAPSPVLAPAGGTDAAYDHGSSLWNWFQRLGVIAPAMALAIGVVGVYQWRAEQRVDEAAAIDLAMLLDEQPLETYADHGYGALLRQQFEN